MRNNRLHRCVARMLQRTQERARRDMRPGAAEPRATARSEAAPGAALPDTLNLASVDLRRLLDDGTLSLN